MSVVGVRIFSDDLTVLAADSAVIGGRMDIVPGCKVSVLRGTVRRTERGSEVFGSIGGPPLVAAVAGELTNFRRLFRLARDLSENGLDVDELSSRLVDVEQGDGENWDMVVASPGKAVVVYSAGTVGDLWPAGSYFSGSGSGYVSGWMDCALRNRVVTPSSWAKAFRDAVAAGRIAGEMISPPAVVFWLDGSGRRA